MVGDVVVVANTVRPIAKSVVKTHFLYYALDNYQDI